jgi:predicted enzyme related to lactoylglutathione lyase
MSSTGKFVWYDLMTTDTKGAEAFYGSVLGWDAKASGMPGQSDYTLLFAGPDMVGGLMPIPADAGPGMPPCWSGYIGVDDVDAYAQRVKAAGGAIQRPPTDIPGIGRFAVVADPQGAVFLLFKGMTGEEPPQTPKTSGHICWRELFAGNVEQALAFYAGLFGWAKGEAHDIGPMGTYQIFVIDGTRYGGMMTRPTQTPGPFWLYYFSVAAMDAAAAKVTAGGGRIINGPMQVPGGGWIAQCMDPQGAMFALASDTR